MIRINLLPEELATAERTPMSLFLVIIGDVVLGMLAILAFVYFHFISLRDVNARQQQAQSDLVPLKKYAAEHQQLTQLKTKYATRNETISNLERTRLSWSRKFYEFSKVLEGKQDQEKHPIWIDNWEPSEPRVSGPARAPARGRAAPAPVATSSYEIKMTIHVARPKQAAEERPIEHYLTAFRRDLTDGKDFVFWQDFLTVDAGGITFPELKPETLAFEHYEEEQFGVSSVVMKMKALDWRFEKPAAAAPKIK